MGNGVFFDTPGLSDNQRRKQAGRAISNGLRKGGDYKVLFVVTQHYGRIFTNDTTTMKLVLDAAPEIEKKYGVIVNMVSEKFIKEMKEKSDEYDSFISSTFAAVEDRR